MKIFLTCTVIVLAFVAVFSTIKVDVSVKQKKVQASDMPSWINKFTDGDIVCYHYNTWSDKGGIACLKQ